MTDKYQEQSSMIARILDILEPLGIEPTAIDLDDHTSTGAERTLFYNCMIWLLQEEIIRSASNGFGTSDLPPETSLTLM